VLARGRRELLELVRTELWALLAVVVQGGEEVVEVGLLEWLASGVVRDEQFDVVVVVVGAVDEFGDLCE
jgi:hypothetical protein